MTLTIRASFVVLIAAVSIMAAAVGAATASGLTPEQLAAAGWTCFPDPVLPRTVCSDPGHGRPVSPPDPNGPAAYDFKIFNRSDDTFLGTIHLIRADLYNGQPCPPLGGAYVLIPPIGYYKCEHF
jgi:hypothetical protein